MNTAELRAAVESRGKDREISIRDSAEPDAVPHEVWVVEPAEDGSRWVVYFGERGEKVEPEYFDTQSEACEHVLAELDPPAAPSYTPSAESDARAAQIAHDVEDDRRRMLRERGIDPDTGRPLG